MLCICVRWKHEDADNPVWLFSELDEGGVERRTVHIWLDGSHARACDGIEVGDASLGEPPIDDLERIALDPQFEVHELSPAAFELVWQKVIDREDGDAGPPTMMPAAERGA